MKLRFVLLTVMIMSLVLTACSGGGNGDDPAKPVKDFFDAFANLDTDKAANAVCKQYRDDLKTGLEFVFAFIKAAGDEAKIEIEDLKLEVKDKSDNEATVVATSGKMKMTMMGETEVTEISGDENMGSIKVIKEDGKWVICDASMAELAGP